MKDSGRVFLIVIAIVAIFFGWKYYTDNYQGKTAYAVVPSEVPAKQQTTNREGKEISGQHSYNYKFEFVLENGEKRTMDYELSGSEVKPFTPNSVVKADIAKKRVINGPNEISKDKIPDKVKKVLNIK